MPGGPGADPTTVITAGVLRTPSLVAVTLAVPASTPITTPLVATATIVAALLAQATRPPTMFPAASFATARSASLRLIPTRARAGTTSTDATAPTGVATGCTVMATLARFSPLAAVTVAFPTATPVSDPSPDTDATAEALLDHATLAEPTTAPAAFLARALSWARSPTRMLAGAPRISTAATDPVEGERSSRYAPAPATAITPATHGRRRLMPGRRWAPGWRRTLILLTGIGLRGVFGTARPSWPRLPNCASLSPPGSSAAPPCRPFAPPRVRGDGHPGPGSSWTRR